MYAHGIRGEGRGQRRANAALPLQNRLPDRLAKAAESQVAPGNLEGLSPIEFLKAKTMAIGVPRATDAVADAVGI
jgi:hypothetical protein